MNACDTSPRQRFESYATLLIAASQRLSLPTYAMLTQPTDKLRELILHITSRLDDGNLGATKLNKLLYFADVLAFQQLGESITGEDYQVLNHGPAARGLLPTRQAMVADGTCVIQPVQRGPYTLHRIVPLRLANLDVFSAAEIAIVDELLQDLHDATGTDLSRFSHDTLPWEQLQQGDSIPLAAPLVSKPVLTREEIDHARTLVPTISPSAA